MRQDGKFILFDISEFASWLEATSFHRVVRLVQNHHTWVPSYSDFNGANHFALLRSMETAHLERGFSEIAQNLTTFSDGTIALCRAIDTIPAGIKGANKNGICIENLGNFDRDKDAMTREHWDCILRLNALLCSKFSLRPDSNTIIYHHWYDLNTGQRTNGTGVTKSCPGTAFFYGNGVSDADTNFISHITEELVNLASGMTARPQALYTAEVAVDALNVRALPSTSAPMVKQINRPVEVHVYEERNGWYRIDAQESCWVDGRFLIASATPVDVRARYAAQVTAEVLNVRTLPSLSGEVVYQLNRGLNVYVYDERDGWSRIDPAKSIWVKSSYLGRSYAATA